MVVRVPSGVVSTKEGRMKHCHDANPIGGFKASPFASRGSTRLAGRAKANSANNIKPDEKREAIIFTSENSFSDDSTSIRKPGAVAHYKEHYRLKHGHVALELLIRPFHVDF